ncbi:DUF637 domain-containing protein, partial [Pseudomonas aeruginosa]|uniref:DUF637 domain-containing protein n=2 Tax=Pseudomonas aeruginosa TaxID=287 RepID=UPI002987FF7F
TIDAMVQADPQLAWLKEAEQRGDVDWRMVQEVHDSWKYSNSGMGPATQIAVAIAAAAIGGMAAAGALSGAGVGASSFAMGAGVGAAGSLSGTAAVSLINNKGDLGKVLKDSFSSDSLKQIAIASLTGGLTAEYFNSWSGAEAHTKIVGGKTVADFSSWGGIGSFAANQGMQNVTSAALSKALGQGGSFGEAFRSSLYNTFAAAGFNQVGNFGSLNELAPGSPPMVAMHALMGGVVSVVSGGDFATGAAAAGANEALVASLDKTFSNLSPDTREQLLTTSSQLIGVLAVVASDQNASSHQLETGAWIAKNSTQYNHELHRANAKSFVNAALDFCKAQPSSCAPGAEKLTQQDLIAALEATAAHGEGINNVKPAALDVVNIFLTNPDLADTLKEDLFTPTASERERLKVNDTAELAMAGISLAQAAKAVLLGNGKALSKLVTGLRKESGEVGAKEIVKVNPPLALPPGKQGSVIRGSLTDHEFKQASEIVSFKGGEFKGVDSSKFAGIDGWLDGVPVQLKVVEGTSINAVRRNIVSGAKDMAKAGYRGDIYIDASRTGVSMNKMLDHFKPGSPVSNVVGEGVVSNVYIKTQDGWVNISAGRVAQHKGWQ